MAKRIVLLVALLIVSLALPVECLIVALPAWYGPYEYHSGDWNATVTQNGTGPVMLEATFRDNDDWRGFPYHLLNLTGTAHSPFVDFDLYGCSAKVRCWYPQGWTSGPGYMPGAPQPATPWGHVVTLDAYALPEDQLGSNYTQDDTRWADCAYGYPGRASTVIACHGDKLVCASIMCHYWGVTEVNPGQLNMQLQQKPDGYLGRTGLFINWVRVAIDTALGYRRNVDLDEVMDRGMIAMGEVNGNTHGVVPYRKAKSNSSYLMWDPRHAGVIDVETYPALGDPGCAQVAGTRLLYTLASYLRPGETASEAGIASGDTEEHVWWGYSAFVAYPLVGDYSIQLTGATKSWGGETLVSINAATGAAITDYILEAIQMPGGSYTLKLKGAPNTPFQLQTYEYASSGACTDRLITGVLDGVGEYITVIQHSAHAVLNDIIGISQVPAGCTFDLKCHHANVTARLASGAYLVESAMRMIPRRATSTVPLEPWHRYLISGVVGADGLLQITSASADPLGGISCRPVLRTRLDSVPGYMYTRLVGKVTAITGEGFTLGSVRVSGAANPEWLVSGMTVAANGVMGVGEFVVEPGSITEVPDTGF